MKSFEEIKGEGIGKKGIVIRDDSDELKKVQSAQKQWGKHLS